jgi:ADP-ribose pyrophosphatase YjhB (NUDIX family)
MPSPITEKVVAYITQGDRLLVFRHTAYPEACIQVPAGTVEEGEPPAKAVLREAREESGLDELEMRAFLGVQDYDLAAYGRAETQRRYFFHLELHGEAPATWRHYETDPSDGSPGPIEFEFYWVRLPDEVPELSGGQGELLSKVECSRQNSQQRLVESALPGVTLPANVTIRAWTDADFADIQRLSSAEGWPTPQNRPDVALMAWRESWPALVATCGEMVIGFLRALTDGAVTTYVAELLVAPQWRGMGIGRALVETCHNLCPSTRLDLLTTGSGDRFYEAAGFRHFGGYRKSCR